MPDRRRKRVLIGVLGALALVGMVLLANVLATVFFAITVAYVLYPLRQWLVTHGLHRRIAAGLCTVLAFVAALALVAPLFAVIYFRRNQLFTFLQQLPDSLSVTVGELTYSVDLAALLSQFQTYASDLALDIARLMPVLALKLFLFALLVYGLLLAPDRLRRAVVRPIPDAHHDLVFAFHRSTRSILYGIYVLQAATALGTFVVAYGVFWALGYESAFVLAALSGILQFIPILGPSVLVVGVGAMELLMGDVTAAILVTGFGLLLVGFLPDALIRPRLATLTAGIPGTLYFIGFTGGVLSVGVVGVIAGPVIVALLVEAINQLADETHPVQQSLD